jgi:hypothetical protein
VYRRITVTHLREYFLGGYASIHTPHAPGFAILALDALEEILQGSAVPRVAREHLVGQRQSFRGHHQSDHHLHASADDDRASSRGGAYLRRLLADRTRNTCW